MWRFGVVGQSASVGWRPYPGRLVCVSAVVLAAWAASSGSDAGDLDLALFGCSAAIVLAAFRQASFSRPRQNRVVHF